MENTLSFLKEATLIKDYDVIKHALESFDINKKGTLLEKYLCFLYDGNGYVAKHVGKKGDGGTDVLLYHPSNLESPMFIVQSKNHQRPLSFDDARSELRKFEDEAKKEYKCKNYILVSINGFVSDCDKLKRTNMKFESWEYICNLIDKYDESCEKRHLKIDLFAHNENSYKELSNFLKISNKAAVVQATGTGKSYIIMQLMLDYNNYDKIIVAPSTLILNQLKDKYVGIIDNTLFLTYQKLSKMKESEFNDLSPKLVIFDELHRLGAPIWAKGYKMLESLFPTAKLVGFSATPIRFLDSQRNMVEELFLGNSTEELSLTDAIVRDILPMPKYISSLYTLDEEINKRKDKIHNSNLDDGEKAKLLSTIDNIALNWEKINGVEGILKKHIPNTSDNLKLIVFCEDQSHLDSMEPVIFTWFKKAFKNKKIKLYPITSKTSGNKEEERLFVNNKSKNTIDILLSINMYNEGIHINGITGVLMLRKTQSNIIYYQQIGRAIDVNSVTPIIFDLVNNFNNFSSINFINNIIESYNKEREYRDSLGLPLLQDNIFLKINDLVSDSLDIFKNVDCIINSDLWQKRYNELVEYKEINGHCNVLVRDGKLGEWVRSQRKAYNNNKMAIEKIKLLEEIGFVWNADGPSWQYMYNKLVKYKEINGHCNVPRKEGKLGNWVKTQRKVYNDGTMLIERINLLEKIGFVWNIDRPDWISMYNELIKYKEVNGHCNVTDKEGRLGTWARTQRVSYRDNNMSEERIKLLEEIGFVWNINDFQWYTMYNKLVEYKEVNGHCNVYVKEGKLGTWVRTQRVSYRDNNMSEERIKLLEEIGFVWNINDFQWYTMYNKLVEYKEVNGHCRISQKESQLSSWSTKQRAAYKNKTLSNDKIKLLEEIGFIWNVR